MFLEIAETCQHFPFGKATQLTAWPRLSSGCIDLNCDSSVGRRFIILFRQRKKEYLSIFLEIAETGFEPATSGL